MAGADSQHSDSVHEVDAQYRGVEERYAGKENFGTVDVVHSDPEVLHWCRGSQHSDSVHLVDAQYSGGEDRRMVDSLHSDPVLLQLPKAGAGASAGSGAGAGAGDGAGLSLAGAGAAGGSS